ncbi:glycosyltransferase family 2 protein [Haloarculaceae archaeon H-GB2-1]|nr:glycosyltransferase family 2 protein [Haloarculaceae archaeon H-GB1-1]MEA5389538.1 glycosyltransferase family 2 protein [Haloarculaceae archaeon H-GB11]MEA5410007.1 glycosyltransferase family 2 protein [Haloarculaceae archaeon H-GB2-1]
MYKGKTVAVVITAYNEEGLVGDVIDTLPTFVDRAYVVDDASTDGTWGEIKRHSTALNAARSAASVVDGDETGEVAVPIRHETNSGVGGAIKTGYRRAYEEGMDVTVVLNGDGQMDPDILDRIIDPIVEGRADYAKGNRLMSREHTGDMSTWRQFGNGILTFLTKVASGYWKTMDPQNGYTAISYRALDSIDIDDLYEEYGFLNDLLVKLNAYNMRVADVEMQAIYGEETSTIRYSTFIPALSLLLLRSFLWRLKVRYLVYDFHPLVLLYALGSVGLLATVVQSGVLIATGIGGVLAWSTVGLAALFSGFALSLAMSFDLMNNEHLERQVLATDSASIRYRSRMTVESEEDDASKGQIRSESAVTESSS